MASQTVGLLGNDLSVLTVQFLRHGGIVTNNGTKMGKYSGLCAGYKRTVF